MAGIFIDIHVPLKSGSCWCVASQHVSLEFDCAVPGFLHDQSHRIRHLAINAVPNNLELLRGKSDYHLMIQKALRSSRFHDRYTTVLLPVQHVAIDAALQMQVCQDGWEEAIRVDARERSGFFSCSHTIAIVYPFECFARSHVPAADRLNKSHALRVSGHSHQSLTSY